jgi:hypothetical protein
VRIEALASFLRDTCADMFVDLVQHTNEVDKVGQLAEVIIWAMRYQASYKRHGGLVERSLDDLAPEMMFNSINALYGR